MSFFKSVNKSKKDKADAMIAENYGPGPKGVARYTEVTKGVPTETDLVRGVRAVAKGVKKVAKGAKSIGKKIIKRYTK